jgi:hypothetical protein
MRTPPAHLLQCLLTLFAITAPCAFAAPDASDGTSTDLPFLVPFELGDTQFPPGDSIVIRQVRGTSEKIMVGGTYSVDGAYTLSSMDEAELAFYATTTSNSSNTTPVDQKQKMRIKKGSGSFHLVKTIHEDGYLHVSLYPGAFGVYFGQGNWVLRSKVPVHSVSLAGPNQALLEYLGNPVYPPANLDARYTKEGLVNAVQVAARKAGITVKRIVIDDSEYPFLVGVVCGGADAVKLKAQIKKMDGYGYSGAVGNDSNSDGSDTCNAFSITPYQAHPREAAQTIDHRLLLRQQVYYDKLINQH